MKKKTDILRIKWNQSAMHTNMFYIGFKNYISLGQDFIPLNTYTKN